MDDKLLIRNDIPTLQEVKSWLGKCFSMKDLGEAAYILRIRVLRDRSKRLIGLSQSTYLHKVLKRFSMQDPRKVTYLSKAIPNRSKTQSLSIEAEIA